MTTFTFDPTDIMEANAAKRVIATFQPSLVEASAETPVASVAETVAPEAEAPVDAVAETFAATVDALGMIHDPRVHQSPPKLKGDGNWTGLRGHKEELAAAIVAFKSGQAATVATAMTAPEPVTGMPAPAAAMPLPASAEPNTPPPPLTYEQVSQRFLGHMQSGAIGDAQVVFDALDIGVDLETNQTSLQRLWHYLTALESGAGHPDAVARTLANVG